MKKHFDWAILFKWKAGKSFAEILSGKIRPSVSAEAIKSMREVGDTLRSRG